MSWTDVATVVGGFATPGAIVVAFAQWGRDKREEGRGHARLVSAELGSTTTSGAPTVVVRNDGPGPVSQVWVKIPGDRVDWHRISKINAGEVSGPILVDPVTGDPSTWFASIGCGGAASNTEPDCDLRFVDVRGKAWRRHGLDKPRRANVPPDQLEAGWWRRRGYRLTGQ